MRTPKSSKAIATAAICIAALVSGVPAAAQEEPSASPPRTVIKALKHVDVATIGHLVELVDIQVAAEPHKNLVVLRGPDSKMETAIKLLDALDHPEPRWGIELMVHLVSAFKEPVSGSGVPADLESALAELTELFGYRGFELVDTVFLYSTTGAGRAGVSAPVRDGGTFQVSFDQAKVIYGEPKQWVRFENLTIRAKGAEIELATNVEVLEDHKVLIGKSSLRGQDSDLVLVIEARLKAPQPAAGG